MDAWRADGFVVLPAFLDADELAPAVAALDRQFPTADEFHDDVDPARNTRYRDEFAGIHPFPMDEVDLNLLAVHPKVTDLAAALLGRDPLDLRCMSGEGWAKYTGAADYDQPLHRDYLNHTQLVTTSDLRFQTVELFIYLVDVPESHGPPHFLSRRHTAELPAIPNWYPRRGGVQDEHGWVSLEDNGRLYELEVSGAGPAGTIAVYSPSTFHRGTAMTAPRGARYTIHVGFRPAEAVW
ncbi:MAG TPA: phytanoyl-CoA dioxygenase family protein, partial [Acidimicrobiales bacterium]|nr:phytanoyl-CoA dioxygenase family protein [Acidimicrobiales bacterium]